MAYPRQRIIAKLQSNYIKLIPTLFKIVLFVKHRERKHKRWVREVYRLTGGAFGVRPKLKEDNNYISTMIYRNLWVDCRDNTKEVISSLLVNKNYMSRSSDFRNEAFLNENIDKVRGLRIGFLNECCEYLGTGRHLTKDKIKGLISKYFEDYVMKVKE